MSKKNRSITISEDYFKILYKAARELEILKNGGVSDWKWYEYRFDDLMPDFKNNEEINNPELILERQVDEQFEKLWAEMNE